MKRRDLQNKLEALLREAGASLGSGALARELVDVIERGNALRLDPEEPPAWMPRRVKVEEYRGGLAFAAVVPDDREDEGTLPLLAAIMQSWTDKQKRLPFLRAMAAAYNERQEINEVPVIVSAWDAIDVSAWTGADDLPNPEPAGKRRDEMYVGGPGNYAPAEETSREFPERLRVDWRLCGALGDMPMLYPPLGRFWSDRHEMGRAYDEAARRWEAEPRLRERIAAAVAVARKAWPATTETVDHGGASGSREVRALYSILTGKGESHG